MSENWVKVPLAPKLKAEDIAIGNVYDATPLQHVVRELARAVWDLEMRVARLEQHLWDQATGGSA